MNPLKNVFVPLFLALAAQSAVAASGSMIKDDTLRAQPSATAASVGQAGKGSAVEVLARQSGWTQIKSGNTTGWVRLLSVRTSTAGSSVTDVGAFLDKRETGKVVAVAGLRGLSEEELKGARFDARELAAMDRFKVDRGGAQQFAQMAGLRTRSIEHLPKPKPPKQETPSDSPFGL